MARTSASYSVIAFRPSNPRASCLKRASARLFRTSFEFIVTIIFFSAYLFRHNPFYCLVVVAGSLFKEKPRTNAGLELRALAFLLSSEVQRAVIYLSDDRDCYRGAGSRVPAVAPALRSAPSAAAFDGEV